MLTNCAKHPAPSKELLNDRERCNEKENGLACHNVALEYLNKDFDFEKIINPALYVEWEKKACGFNYITACVNLHRYFSVIGNELEAFKYGKKACALRDSDVNYLVRVENKLNKENALKTCVAISEMFLFNDSSVYKDKLKALALCTMACEKDLSEGCFSAAMMYRIMGEKEKGSKLLEKGCSSLRESMSCVALFEDSLKENNLKRAEDFYEKLKKTTPYYPYGYFIVASVLWKIKKDPAEAVNWLKQGLQRKGFSVEDIENEENFKSLLGTSEYVEMVKRYKNK